jgi:hypothetical protein
VDPDAMRGQQAMQPKAVSAGLEATHNIDAIA